MNRKIERKKVGDYQRQSNCAVNVELSWCWLLRHGHLPNETFAKVFHFNFKLNETYM